VVIEGISLTRNYRSQFQTILRRQSFEELLARMRRTSRRLGPPAQ
jgi:ABC-type transporter MlaC component